MQKGYYLEHYKYKEEKYRERDGIPKLECTGRSEEGK